MRPDMSKIVTERPRSGSYLSYHAVRRRNMRGDLEDLPTKQGMRHVYSLYGYRQKEFSDLLGPLWRYLHQQIGRKWNDVWSEICTNLRTDSTTQQHIRDHIEQRVVTDAIMIDGKVYGSTASYARGRVEAVMYDTFYAHPENGTLCFVGFRGWKRNGKLHAIIKKNNDLNHFRRLKDDSELWKISGIWYWAIWDIVPLPRVFYITERDGRRTEISRHAQDKRNHNDFRKANNALNMHAFKDEIHREGEAYRCGKKQLSHRELKKYHLQND